MKIKRKRGTRRAGSGRRGEFRWLGERRKRPWWPLGRSHTSYILKEDLKIGEKRGKYTKKRDERIRKAKRADKRRNIN